MTIVFKVSDNVKELIIKHYMDRRCEKTPPYAIFQVKDYDCVTTLYESGKIMFQGLGADIESSYWIEQERILNNRIIDINGKEKKDKEKKKDTLKEFVNVSSIGSDEVGFGDYFGPLVVTASYVSLENFYFLKELGVKDSKKMTDEKIIKIAPEIMKVIPYTCITLSNKEYNDYYNSKANMNMNKIKAILHNKCLLSLLKKDNINYKKIVIDQFESPKSYYNHLSDVPVKVKNISFMTKAEDYCYSVAVSSIISRYIFLKEMKKLEEQYNVLIPLGAGEVVDKQGVLIVKKYGEDILKLIAKYNFKNTNKILDMIKQDT